MRFLFLIDVRAPDHFLAPAIASAPILLEHPYIAPIENGTPAQTESGLAMTHAQAGEGYESDDFDDFEEALRTGHPGTAPQQRVPGVGESPERHRPAADEYAKVQGPAPEVATSSPWDLNNLSGAIQTLPSSTSHSATLIDRRKTSYHKKESSMSAPAEKPLFEVGEIRIARRVTQKASSPSIRSTKTSPARQQGTPRTPLSPTEGVQSIAKAEDWQTRSSRQYAPTGALLSPADCHSAARTPVRIVKTSQASEQSAVVHEVTASGPAGRSTEVDHQSIQAGRDSLTPVDCLTPRGRRPQGTSASTASVGVHCNSPITSPSQRRPEVNQAGTAKTPCQINQIDIERPDKGSIEDTQTRNFGNVSDELRPTRPYVNEVSPDGDSHPLPPSAPPLAVAIDTPSQNGARQLENIRQSLPSQPHAARQALLRPEDIAIEEIIIMESHATLFDIRRRIISAVPDVGLHSSSAASCSNFGHAKALRQAEAQLAAREADLTIEALSRSETANVEINIYTEQCEGQWMVRGPASADIKRVDVLPSVLDVWKVPLDTKSIVERGKLRSTLELAKTRRAIPCSECCFKASMDVQCPRCAGTGFIETIFVITITLRVSSFGPLKLPACHLAGVILPGVKYMQSPSEVVRSALLREQTINTVLRAARRVGQEHYEAYGARLLLAKAKLERRGRMTVRVTSSRTGVGRCFDVGDEGGDIVEVSETGTPIAVIEPAPLATASTGPTHSYSSSKIHSSRPSTAQSAIYSPPRTTPAGAARRPTTSGSDIRFRETSRKSRYSTQIERPAPGPGSGLSAQHGPRPSTSTASSSSSLSFSLPLSRSQSRPARFFTGSTNDSLASLRSEDSERLSPVGEQGAYARERDSNDRDRTRRRSDETVRGSQGTTRMPASQVRTSKGLRRLFSRG